MRRAWHVAPDYMEEVPVRHPDTGLPVYDEDGAVVVDHVPTVSKGALEDAMVEAAAMLRVAGGTVQVVVGRSRGSIDHEMFVNAVVLEWQDRTNAKASREQPSTAQSAAAGESDEPAADDALRAVLDRAADLDPRLAHHLVTGEPLDLDPRDEPVLVVDDAPVPVTVGGDDGADLPGLPEVDTTSVDGVAA